MNRRTHSDAYRLAVVCIAAAIMALNIRILVKNGGLYPGGATGLTILIQGIFEKFFSIKISYTLVNVILNSIPVYIGFRYIGKKFTSYSLLMILLSSVLVDIIPHIVLTNDVLLISIFGGIINGVAIGLCLSVDATSGGTDFISIYLSQKSGKDSFNIILGINVVILVLAGLLFGWNKALYSIIFQFASTQTLHFLYRNYQQVTLFVVTTEPEKVSHMIYDLSRHGATILEGRGGYQGQKKYVVYSVIDAPMAENIEKKIHAMDEQAFVNCIATKEILGKVYLRPKD
ncbi:MAG: YitT family protein [Eubacterium sp.]|nr:YitT family protein [Eubacterium sp.]